MPLPRTSARRCPDRCQATGHEHAGRPGDRGRPASRRAFISSRTSARGAAWNATVRYMAASVGFLVIDSVNPAELARFWGSLLEVQVDSVIGDGLVVGFQQVPEAKAGKNRLHLDLVVADLDASTAEIEQLGGTWLEAGHTRELEGFRWRCMADPDGNEFDIDTLPAS